MPIRTKHSRNAATLVCSVTLAGCVGVQIEELLASTAIVAELQPESGALVEAARFSAGHASKAPAGPYAMLMYIWSSDAPVGTIVPNNYTDKIQMFVVDSGSYRIDEWREIRGNALEDYRLVFGEQPSDIVAVGVMIDAGNTRQKARTQYGDITFRLAQ